MWSRDSHRKKNQKMKTLLTIDGTQLETGLQTCLYLGLHDTQDASDVMFHRYLVRHYQDQGWHTTITMSFHVERKKE
jgi:hypothetical protein